MGRLSLIPEVQGCGKVTYDSDLRSCFRTNLLPLTRRPFCPVIRLRLCLAVAGVCMPSLTLWVPTLVSSCPSDTDELHVRQKVQEITRILSATHLSGNPYQHRRRSTWLQSRVGHRPKRSVESFHHDREPDGRDWTVTPGEKNPRTSRIVFHDKKSEDQALPTPETSAPGVVDSAERGNDPTSECS